MPLIDHAFHVVARSVARGPSGYPRVIISTDQRDAEGDIIEQAGLIFRDPLPVLVGHSYKDIPVGVTTRIIRGPHATEAEFRWIEGDTRADMARNAFNQGALCASIGFRPLGTPEHDPPGYRFRKAQVVEFSLVPVPANAGCTPTLLRSLGFKEGTPMRRDDDVVLEILDDEPVHAFAHQRAHFERAHQRIRAEERARELQRAIANAYHYPVSYGEIVNRGDLSEGQKRKVLADNCRRLYGL